MTFKYFRTRSLVIARAGRPRETREREMDEESHAVVVVPVLPKLASYPAMRRVEYFDNPFASEWGGEGGRAEVCNMENLEVV